MKLRTTLLAGAALALAGPAFAQVHTDAGTINPADVARLFKAPGYSPYAGRNYPTQLLWGEAHLHTSWSPDAMAAGARVGPDDALRFAKGEEITSNTGQQVKLSRPYDWMVVADHSDAMGVVAAIAAGDPEMMKDPILKRWSEGINAGGEAASAVVMEMITAQGLGQVPPAMTDPQTQFDIWRDMTKIVESHNEPGHFSAIIGYEWTSNYGGGNNLHRNVIYRDGKALADMVRPLTTFDTENPEELWDWMAGYEDKTGGRLLAIPHNGNLSNGLTFAGDPLTAEWAETRARWEPLVEITQSKGTSEQHPSLAPNDEFANFEIWDKGNLNVVPKEPGMIPHEYAREALKNGLAIEAELGVNPFKFGMIGSTDSHTGISAAEENNFFGKFPQGEPSAERAFANAFNFDGRIVEEWRLGAGGLTGVWAEENTRESIWDAMKRKEVYGTTGPRIALRFFGGWDFTAGDMNTRVPAQAGYSKGVPMGGDLPPAPEGVAAPSFLVAAMKDPYSGNLDRIQIVKGWLDAEGKPQEQVFDVVWSDDRVPGADGKLPSVGTTVDLETATWTNTIGDPELITTWTDPTFDASQRAFYYARVIEIPTPRWTAFDAAYFDLDLGPEVDMIVTERAYSSPIWYTP
jgi:hypothetical protein